LEHARVSAAYAAARRHPLWVFFVLANLLSWVAWATLAAAGLGWTTLRFSPYLHLVGGLGPLIASVVVTLACEGRAGLKRWLARSLGVRGRRGWIVFAIAGPVLIFAASAIALGVIGSRQVAWADVGRSVEYPALSRGAYCVANLLFYGFGEELGWRGFALPRLQLRRTALTSALLIGAAWGAWHLPLFAFAGGLSSMRGGALVGWFFSIVTGSVVMTWLFNASRGSVLPVALFHGVLDILMTSPVHPALASIMGAAITIYGLAIVVVLGRENLAHIRRIQDPGSSEEPRVIPTGTRSFER
jgi:membrane protease YdiL (CAAX protease family)